MPLIPILIAAGAGAGVGFIGGRGTDGLGNIIKWGVIGAGGYVIAKNLKWI